MAFIPPAVCGAQWSHCGTDQCRDKPEDRWSARGFAFDDAAADPGLGSGNGYQMFIEDRGNFGYGKLQEAVQAMQGTVAQTPAWRTQLRVIRPTCRNSMPMWIASKPRRKGRTDRAVRYLADLSGSTYVNDFNQFGRTRQVIAQADGAFRDSVEDIGKLQPVMPRRDGTDWFDGDHQGDLRSGPGAAF